VSNSAGRFGGKLGLPINLQLRDFFFCHRVYMKVKACG
jgi:hypothetical protein